MHESSLIPFMGRRVTRGIASAREGLRKLLDERRLEVVALGGEDGADHVRSVLVVGLETSELLAWVGREIVVVREIGAHRTRDHEAGVYAPVLEHDRLLCHFRAGARLLAVRRTVRVRHLDAVDRGSRDLGLAT